MTTTQPAALPELPEPFALSLSIHDGENCKWPLLECKLLQKHPAEKQHLYTAYQMRAYALAALQPQPAAAVSDEEINRIVWEHTRLNPNQAADSGLMLCIRNAVRAILALRPQAVPMTEAQVRVLRFLLGESALDGCHFGDMHPDKRGRFWWRDSLREAFGITAQGAQGGEG